MDSPRMNPSGRVVFQGLERSSSSPSSFNGGPRYNNSSNSNGNGSKHGRGGIMERSYSGNVHVRITPVLNVPVVCSLRRSSNKSGVFGFGQLFSSSSHSQRKDSNNNNNGGSGNSRSFHLKKEGNNNNGGGSSSNKNKREKEKEKESS